MIYTYFLISTLSFQAEEKVPQSPQIFSSYFLTVNSYFMFLIFVGDKLKKFAFKQ